MFRLVPSRGPYLEAKIDETALPAQMTAKVQFKKDAPEYRFDFTFPELSKEPVQPVAAASRNATPDSRTRDVAARPAASSPTPPPAPGGRQHDGPGSGFRSSSGRQFQRTVEEILAQLKVRNDQIRRTRPARRLCGRLGACVSGEGSRSWSGTAHRGPSRTQAQRSRARDQLEWFERHGSWMHTGDLGNRQQIVDAYSMFTSAVSDVVSTLRAETVVSSHESQRLFASSMVLAAVALREP